MTTDQIIIFAVLAATLGLFIWDKLRYDVVAVLALLAVALTGLIPADDVFSGLGHPAVVTVAAVLILGQALVNAGVVDVIARQLTRVGSHPTIQMAALTVTVAVCSGFMNNVGALALLMPVAIWMSRTFAINVFDASGVWFVIGWLFDPDWYTTEYYYCQLSCSNRFTRIRHV